MSDETDLVAALIDWFRQSQRRLPWRTEPRDPYHVLVSELMLQQTQVDRVVSRFQAFIARFPTIEALAEADETAVLEAWSGLGYYRRARMLHRAARAVCDEQGGALPRTVAALEALPGVGPYTAAAVASLSFGVAAPVLDGNVARVASRVLASAEDPRKKKGAERLRRWVSQALLAHHDDPGEVNEALMELGATVCSPRNPQCLICPLSPRCAGRARGRPEDFPRPPAKGKRAVEEHTWVAACVIDDQGRWLLRPVSGGPVLQGLWLPPLSFGGAGEPAARARALVPDLGAGRTLPAVRHSITFRRLTVVPVVFDAGEEPAGEGWAWARPESPGGPTSSLLAKLAARVDEDEER